MPAPRSDDSLLRLAGKDDLEQIISMLVDFYAEEGYPVDRAEISRVLSRLIEDRELGRLWLVVDAGAVVGYVAICFGYSLEYHGRDAFVDDLYLRPEARGKGLGTRVLEVVEPACRALGVRTLHLEVERDNSAAQALYRRRGFRDNDRLLLSKRLIGD
jgi:ribosomal protein S18 acetylase RimI-like enzyme